MNAKELRLGNIVSFNGYISTVYQLSKSGAVLEYEGQTNTEKEGVRRSQVHADDIKPIDITEEWLKKFGFYDYKDIVKIYKLQLNTKINGINSFNLMINSNNEFYFYPAISSYLRVKLEFVYQLQNIYFAIIGEELTIKA